MCLFIFIFKQKTAYDMRCSDWSSDVCSSELASYGGYMMNWIAGQWTDGFKCLVQHDGVFDLRAMAFETEELWLDEWDHGGPWWERTDPEKWNPVDRPSNVSVMSG